MLNKTIMLSSELNLIHKLEKCEEAAQRIQGHCSENEGLNNTIKSLQEAIETLTREVRQLQIERQLVTPQ